jgi:hypothetical protein
LLEDVFDEELELCRRPLLIYIKRLCLASFPSPHRSYFYNVLSWLNRLGQEKKLWFRNPAINYYYYYYLSAECRQFQNGDIFEITPF